MKPLIKVKHVACILICLAAFYHNAYSQGTGNHLTMTLDSCRQINNNNLQFDLFITSDGTSTSDVRLNSAQWGVNYNPAILQAGAVVTPTYVANTTDFVGLNGFSFPNPASNPEVRIVQAAYTN